VQVQTSRSYRAAQLLPSITRSEHQSTEAAVMGAQIEQLPDLSGYLKLASAPDWRRVRLQPPSPQRAVLAAAAPDAERDQALGHGRG
jgi:hypothetical protein